jgi:hypothetical protein
MSICVTFGAEKFQYKNKPESYEQFMNDVLLEARAFGYEAAEGERNVTL